LAGLDVIRPQLGVVEADGTVGDVLVADSEVEQIGLPWIVAHAT